MELRINGVEIAAYPSAFTVTTMDLDDAATTTRTADGTLNRDRVAVKRQIEMTFPPLPWAKVSAILQAMGDVFFDFYYPDPYAGEYVTKRFYVGNRPAPVALVKNGELYWGEMQITLTEQ